MKSLFNRRSSGHHSPLPFSCRSAYAVFAVILLGLHPFVANAATNLVTIQQLIGILKANESVLSNVVVEGSRVRTIFGKDDKPVQQERLELYRFSRAGDRMKEESQGEWGRPQTGTEKADNLSWYQILYFANGSSVRLASPNSNEGSEWSQGCPMPFPLLFGYGVFCDGRDGKLGMLSSIAEEALSDGRLTLSEDKVATNLVMIEFRVKPQNGYGGASRFWFDATRGYVLVRMKNFVTVPHTEGELYFEGFEAVPKQYDGQWYIETARYEECPKAIEGVCSQHEVDELHVRRFETNVHFKRGDFDLPKVRKATPPAKIPASK